MEKVNLNTAIQHGLTEKEFNKIKQQRLKTPFI